MGKLEAVVKTKQANNRLKPVGDTCVKIVTGHETRPLDRVRKLLDERLDREITEVDEAGPALQAALATFWEKLDTIKDRDLLMEYALAVYSEVRNVQSARWKAVEAKHGKVGHYFDAFGQIKRGYMDRWLGDHANDTANRGVSLIKAIKSWYRKHLQKRKR